MRSTANNDIGGRWGFTIVELLVVLAIIGLLSIISLPMMKGIGRSNTMVSATRQMLDDLALARHKALTGRTTVHVIFVPPPGSLAFQGGSMMQLPEWKLRERLQFSAYTTYALYAERAPGDQPGQRSGRYLTKWRTLPEGVFIAQEKFAPLAPNTWYSKPDLWRPFEYAGQTNQNGVPGLPFPAAVSGVDPVQVPHIAFDHNGSLVQYDQGNSSRNRVYLDEYIWLTRGSIL